MQKKRDFTKTVKIWRYDICHKKHAFAFLLHNAVLNCPGNRVPMQQIPLPATTIGRAGPGGRARSLELSAAFKTYMRGNNMI